MKTKRRDGDSSSMLGQLATEHPGSVERDAMRYRWLREHFRFAEDSMQEIWFDASIKRPELPPPYPPGIRGESIAPELDRSIDRCMGSTGSGSLPESCTPSSKSEQNAVAPLREIVATLDALEKQDVDLAGGSGTRGAEHPTPRQTPRCDALAAASNGRDIQQSDYYAALDLARALERGQCHHGWRGSVPQDGQRIVTPCPECGAQSLFIGSGGHLTCARVPSSHGISDGCTNPSVADVVAKLKATSALYYELLFAVGNRYPGETRHQTALRYIRRAEEGSTSGSVGGCVHAAKQSEQNTSLRAAVDARREDTE